jgi:hypothetical protein
MLSLHLFSWNALSERLQWRPCVICPNSLGTIAFRWNCRAMSVHYTCSCAHRQSLSRALLEAASSCTGTLCSYHALFDACRFACIGFPHIRHANDYASGVLLHKKEVKASQLKWQCSPICKSLYDFKDRTDLSKLAVRAHKYLLGTF